MRDKAIDLWETLFITLSLFATVLSALHPYFSWLVVIALGIQLFDFASTPDHAIDFVVLLLLALAIAPMVCPALVFISQYAPWILAIALAFQLYDDYAS